MSTATKRKSKPRPTTAQSDSNRTSIVTVDPVVASQITRAGDQRITSGANKSTTTALVSGHTRTESTPIRAVNKASLTIMSKGHARTASAPSSKKRSNSLKRVKNSTEVLKLRSQNAEKAATAKLQAEQNAVKRGRNFTVSNVGTGGTLHLSPRPHQQPFSTGIAHATNYQWTAQGTVTSPAMIAASPALIQTSHGRTRSISPKRLLTTAVQSNRSRDFLRAHNRSQSFSTLDESRRSMAAALQPKTLKIVINRPDQTDSSEDEEAAPTLQIPIPHYRLGTPRFSAHGTPFLRGSSYHRASDLTTTDQSTATDLAGGPPLSSMRAFSKINRSLQSDQSSVPMPNPLRIVKHFEDGRSESIVSYVAPIVPELYDRLTKVYDDPTVVRYANDKEIAAATKIRIIAQISSESFMDYDLVSDFFLTFRSYMTTFEVLDYLLARLKWSVGRLSEDGRIIRIRTFAALRHWILNYFEDDFVVNRQLRVRFCEEVNELYTSVISRPRGIGGISDLKILQDLKRCWNGRCALFWDAEEFNMDSNQEEPLIPGGVLGSRNPGFADISEATAALGLNVQDLPESSLAPSVSIRPSRKPQHKRLPSSEYAKKSTLRQSIQSLHVTSCSLPRYKSRSPEGQQESLERGPQPVSVLARRHNAPATLQVEVNAAGEPSVRSPQDTSLPSPVEMLAQSGHYQDPHAGSMIRGFVYGPVEPFVQLPLHPPLSPSLRFSLEQQNASSMKVPHSPQLPHHGAPNPAVKNIFGSIRRALSGKQGTNEVAMITVSAPRPSASTAGPRAPVPIAMAKSNDDLRRRAASSSIKTQLRIDLLCAAAVQSFQTVVPVDQSARGPSASLPNTPSVTLFPTATGRPEDSAAARFPSQYTAKSGSILIVDDTAVAMPVMSGTLPTSYHRQESHDTAGTTPLQGPPSFDTQIAFDDEEVEDDLPLQRHDSESAVTGLGMKLEPVEARSDSVETVHRLPSSPTVPQMAARSDGQSPSMRTTSPPSTTEGTSKSEDPISKPSNHALRRRPGGDLRNNQNVQDLEVSLNHQSLDSLLESSVRAPSQASPGQTGSTKASVMKPPKPSDKVSMINTHSSQHLRPSFEAAISGFSAIPDDDDGGLEATLSKLEGRYEDRSPTLSGASASPLTQSLTMSIDGPLTISTEPTDHGQSFPHGYRHDKGHNVTSSFYDAAVEDEDDDERDGHARQGEEKMVFAHRSVVFGLPTESPTGSDSDDSEVSLPLLKRNTSTVQSRSIQGSSANRKIVGSADEDSVKSSSDILKSGSDGQGKRPTTAATDATTSFLFDDEDDNRSDLSSEISVDIPDFGSGAGKTMSPMLTAPGTAISGLEIPSHPLTYGSLINLPATSPALANPGSPGFSHLTPSITSPQLSTRNSFGQRAAAPSKPGMVQGPAHVPFILACDSQVLAQQLTLVEQSALTEIEWSDLVEMRWNNDKSGNTLDWAEYMAKHDDARGIDVVSARFNLVHKWVQSEIVLTQDIEERARVLSKFIHVAAHARRLHNYATMLQITIALATSSISRLKQTWELVPPPDRSLLKHMEDLARPQRNFHDLRVEMESTDLSTGCIPFLGLYIHDLTYNANKPAEIRVQEESEALINFERFRTAAVIIKGLLRLIDASLRYEFEPIHGIVERCLWLSALTAERIDTLSKGLEA